MKKVLLAGAVVVALGMFILIDYYRNSYKKSLYTSVYYTNHVVSQEKKPIFVWDLHQVLFDRPFLSMLRRGLWNIKNKPLFLKQFIQAWLNKKVRADIYRLKEKHVTVSQAYFDTAQEYPHVYQELIHLANALYEPNKELFAFIKYLQEQGYQNYVFSNIGPRTLKDLQAQYSEYFSYFSSLSNTINGEQPEDATWICKPEEQAYQHMLRAIKAEKSPERVVFIDDRIKNIEKAHKKGINGILYLSNKQVITDCKAFLPKE